MPDEPPDVTADLSARGRLSRPQDDRDGAPGGGVVDVDRQEAAGIIVGVEERELLAPCTTSQVSSISSVTEVGGAA